MRHFGEAVLIYDEGHTGETERSAYRTEMAPMHAMQSGYTSFESALLQTFEMLGEDKPVGEHWHKQLVERAARELPGRRPAILPPTLKPLTRHVRGFRHWAAHGYDEPFSRKEAANAIEAARYLATDLRAVFEEFIRTIDA